MVRDPAYGLSAEALEFARQRYETTNDPMSDIAADAQKCRATMYNIAKAQGWPLRRDRPPCGLSPALKLGMQAAEALANGGSQASKAEARSADPDTPADD